MILKRIKQILLILSLIIGLGFCGCSTYIFIGSDASIEVLVEDCRRFIDLGVKDDEKQQAIDACWDNTVRSMSALPVFGFAGFLLGLPLIYLGYVSLIRRKRFA